eukprot:3289931-Prymnesium_polylepis.1
MSATMRPKYELRAPRSCSAPSPPGSLDIFSVSGVKPEMSANSTAAGNAAEACSSGASADVASTCRSTRLGMYETSTSALSRSTLGFPNEERCLALTGALPSCWMLLIRLSNGMLLTRLPTTMAEGFLDPRSAALHSSSLSGNGKRVPVYYQKSHATTAHPFPARPLR